MLDQPRRRKSFLHLAARQIVPLAILMASLWFLWGNRALLDPGEIGRAITGIPPSQWLLATAATLLSFWAVGRYESVLHRHFRTCFDDATTWQTGIAAIALSQTLGTGIVTGALALVAIDLWRAIRWPQRHTYNQPHNHDDNYEIASGPHS
jgi:phosphatidylglycerol lysyltransferase